MNDAGTVIVADVYPAGEAPIPGVTRDALVEGLRARGHRSVVPLPSPARLAEMVFAIAKPGDFVVCLGAGNITQWAAALPGEAGGSCKGAVSRVRGRPSPRHGTDGEAAPHDGRIRPDFVDTLPPLRGRVQANAPLAPFTWFRVGGPAEALVRPADAERPRAVPARPAARHPGARDRRLLEPDHPRRRAAWRGDPPGARLRRDLGGSRMASSPVPRRST